ncbi:hypothetical protein PENSPDRAFT_659863 [Peniophora sp. CONT]|nr:hypothetical protein PENSPDRAFT_659863 [Peniophora sp. CONT]
MSVPPDRHLLGSYTDADGRAETYTYSLNDFRDAYTVRAQSAGPLSRRDRKTFEELTYWMMFTEEMKEVDPDTYATVLDLHLEKLMLEILARDDFYDEHWKISTSIVRGLVRMINWVHSHPSPGRREKAAAARVVASVEKVGETMWKNRARLPFSFTFYRDIIDEEDPVVSLVLLFMHLCDRAEPAVIPDIVLKLVLHVWLTVPYRLNMFDTAFEYHTRLVQSSGPLNFSTPEYVREAIIDGVGADAFMLRLLEDLKRPEISDRYAAALFEALRVMGMTALLRPYFIKHKCVDAVAQAIERRCIPENGDKFRAIMYQNALVLMHLCSVDLSLDRALRKPDVPVPGGYIIDVLTRGVNMAPNSYFEPQLRRSLRASIHVFAESADDVAFGKDKRAHARTFLSDMKARAKEIWWPSLARLQVAHYIAQGNARSITNGATGSGESSKQFAGLLKQWEAFGVSCGLDAEKERRRNRREGRTFCSWAACRWSTVKPPDGITLKLCQGCGEAQYCGRDCQKIDWSKGRHKERCGNRIKGA